MELCVLGGGVRGRGGWAGGGRGRMGEGHDGAGWKWGVEGMPLGSGRWRQVAAGVCKSLWLLVFRVKGCAVERWSTGVLPTLASDASHRTIYS